MQRLLQHDTQVAAGLYFTVKSLNLAVQCGIIEIRPKYEWRKFLWQIKIKRKHIKVLLKFVK